jgi:Mlc titration factor MtfA (ptsG expression regulator)
MSREFEALQRADEAGTPTLLDTYGATNPAEFFAVATEAFFERPLAMRAKQPELYAQLAAFYCQDPISYSAEAAC